MKTAVVIPARWGSTRLPGKPLVMIAGQTLLSRVALVARVALKKVPRAQLVVATDDQRVGRHCSEIGVPWLMTPKDCPTGTDRVEAAVRGLKERPDFVINLQGDAPFTPPGFIAAMIASYRRQPADFVTPVTRLSWEELGAFRESKKTTPLSGTCAVFDPKTREAYWFSKSVIPAVRAEDKLRVAGEPCPVYRHIGLYGYRRAALARFVRWPVGRFERLEGLEQLRVLENGGKIRCVPVDYRGRPAMSGIDSLEDVTRAEALIAKFGEPLP